MENSQIRALRLVRVQVKNKGQRKIEGRKNFWVNFEIGAGKPLKIVFNLSMLVILRTPLRLIKIFVKNSCNILTEKLGRFQVSKDGAPMSELYSV